MNDVLTHSPVARFMVIATGCVAIVAGMHAIAPILNPIFIAVLFAVLFDIPRSWLKRRGMSDGLALTVTIVGALVITLLFLFVIGNTVLNLRANLTVYDQQLQAQLEALSALLARFGMELDQLRTLTQSGETNPVGIIRYALKGVANVLAGALLILVYAIFLLIEVNRFPKKLNEAFNPSDTAYRYITRITGNLRNFLVTQTQVSLITGAAVTIVLWLLGVRFAVLWGFVAFLMNFVPYIGSILAAIPALVVAFIQFGPTTPVLLVIVAYLSINLVVSYGVYPRMMGRDVDLSIFMVLASMMFWGWVLGPTGLILSVPLTVVIKISLESYPGSRWLGVMLGSGQGTKS